LRSLVDKNLLKYLLEFKPLSHLTLNLGTLYEAFNSLHSGGLGAPYGGECF